MVTTTSSPSCFHSSFSLSRGVYLRSNNLITSLGMVVLPPLLRIVVPRRSSSDKSTCQPSCSTLFNRSPSFVSISIQPAECQVVVNDRWGNSCQARLSQGGWLGVMQGIELPGPPFPTARMQAEGLSRLPGKDRGRKHAGIKRCSQGADGHVRFLPILPSQPMPSGG